MKNASPTERFVQIKQSMFESVAFRTLPPSALKLWIDLRTAFRGRNNGNISAALRLLRIRGWVSSDTLNSAIWVLLERGLLRRTRSGKPGPMRVASLYAFTDLPTNLNDRLGIAECGPTNEYLKWVPGMSFAPDSKAKRLAANPNAREKLLQNLEPHRSEIRTSAATESGKLTVSTTPDSESGSRTQNQPEGAPVLRLQ